MPIHDWTKVEAGIFHAFHHDYITEISRALNAGLLPGNYYALPEQDAGNGIPDVLTLVTPDPGGGAWESGGSGGTLTLAPPKVKFQFQSEARKYVAKAKRIAIRHISRHQIVAMIEIVSPGNKSGKDALEQFVRKAHSALRQGVHLLIVDFFPPGPRDPEGIHRAIWGEDPEDPFFASEAQPLLCVSYTGDPGNGAFIQPMAVGEAVPLMPLFYTVEDYVEVPLDAAYMKAFEGMPAYWRSMIEA